MELAGCGVCTHSCEAVQSKGRLCSVHESWPRERCQFCVWLSLPAPIQQQTLNQETASEALTAWRRNDNAKELPRDS